MYLYTHHTAGDIIDLDDRTGYWTVVEEKEDSPMSIGQMPMIQRANFPVKGSYTVEAEKPYFFYWNENGELVFRTPDGIRFSMFRLKGGNALTELMPDMTVQLEPATHHDGRAVPHFSTFRFTDVAGITHFETSYNSDRYMQFYLSNFTFVPDEDLGDWDFFVAVKAAVEELRLIARSQRATKPEMPTRSFVADEVLTAESGSPTPRAGVWVPSDCLTVRRQLALGELVPNANDRPSTWVWVGP